MSVIWLILLTIRTGTGVDLLAKNFNRNLAHFTYNKRTGTGVDLLAKNFNRIVHLKSSSLT